MRKKKPKAMARAKTFPPNPDPGRSPNLKWCLERLKNVKEEKMATIMPEVKFRPSWRSFDFQELVDATDGFSEGRLLLFNWINFRKIHCGFYGKSTTKPEFCLPNVL
jgi:hypothetical protein